MNIDFPLILVVATALAGLIWLIDALFFAPGRRARAAETDHPNRVRDPALVEYARSFFPILLVVLILRSFVTEPFRIPSGSMMPTLLVGDFILVNKFSYGVRLPVTNTELFSTGEPKRGEVAVFRYPDDPSVNYIKRVVGVPGDHVRYEDKVFYINGERIPQETIGVYEGEGARYMPGAQVLEESWGDLSNRIIVESGPSRLNGEFEVPEGHYFMVGDNRDNSNDSRFWGPVSEDQLVGRAYLVWMHWGNDGLEPGRIGTRIQ